VVQEHGPSRPEDSPPDDRAGGGAAGDGTPEDGQGADDQRRGPVSRLVRNKRFVKLVAVLITLALVYYAFFVVLPSEISWEQVQAALQALTAREIAALVVAGLILMVALGWAAKASLPGLTLYQGFESSATSQMTAFVVPPPGDYVIRFAMYRTYGFSDEQSGASVLISMVLRYVAIFFMPILGLLAVIVAGTATSAQVWWFAGLTVAFVIVCWLMLRVVHSDAVAHSIGRRTNAAVAWAMGLFHRTPAGDLERSIVSFGQRTRATVTSRGPSLTASNLVWALGNAVVLLMSMRFSGLGSSTVPLATALLACGYLMVVNILPIPGKSALAAPTLFTIMSLTTDADQSAMTAAILLYRVVTWLLPMPVGAAMFFVWRYRVRRDTVTTVPEDPDEIRAGTGA
jgi:putative heme transporter